MYKMCISLKKDIDKINYGYVIESSMDIYWLTPKKNKLCMYYKFSVVALYIHYNRRLYSLYMYKDMLDMQ